jgi:NAD(P)-dependent dehydrogenase (short-subunit alcohol dehydrogenase family)
MSPPLADRIALVTGASRGIGYATALALAKAGAHIIALARTVGGLEELDDAVKLAGGSATLVPLDLKDYAGIDRLGLALRERFGRLDVLVGNAGILGPLSPLGHVEAKAWDEVMAVNVTANWRLICAMDPLLRLSDAGRAVFVSSGARNARAHLCGGDRNDECSRQSFHTGADPHPYARAGVPGRGPDDAGNAGQGCGQDRRLVPAEHAGERQALRLS